MLESFLSSEVVGWLLTAILVILLPGTLIWGLGEELADRFFNRRSKVVPIRSWRERMEATANAKDPFLGD